MVFDYLALGRDRMTEYTPTTEQVRKAYGWWTDTIGEAEETAEFDRWLEQHDQELREQIVEELLEIARYINGREHLPSDAEVVERAADLISKKQEPYYVHTPEPED